MFRGVQLQSETHKLETRPYISLTPLADSTITETKDNLYEVSFIAENISKFPAKGSINYGLIVIDDDPLFGINCRTFKRNTPKESKEIVEAQNNCTAKLPGIQTYNDEHTVCVNNNLQRTNIPPGSKLTLKFSFKKELFNRLLKAKDTNGSSGIFSTVVYTDTLGRETYSTQSGFLPYKAGNNTYSMKVF